VKVILSRKGTDSGVKSGAMPSLILPCECLCFVPIPYPSGARYSEIRFGNRTLHDICSGLQKYWKDQPAHLDPDLRADSLAIRPFGWRPAFGQSGPSASHLNNQGVTAGDLFVFFGWFRKTEVSTDGTLRFCPSDKHGRHIIFGWLEVEEIVEVGDAGFSGDQQFLNRHAHVQFVKERPNQIYIGSRSGLGSGSFSKDREQLVLTKPNCKRSEWRLPSAFESVFRERDMTYHKSQASRWQLQGDEIWLRAVSRGQEFVIDGAKHGAVIDHFSNLIRSASESSTPCTHDSALKRRIFGSAKGEFTVPDDFNEPDPEIEDLFYK
jgi:Nucleotide modification associated domain 3